MPKEKNNSSNSIQPAPEIISNSLQHGRGLRSRTQTAAPTAVPKNSNATRPRGRRNASAGRTSDQNAHAPPQAHAAVTVSPVAQNADTVVDDGNPTSAATTPAGVDKQAKETSAKDVGVQSPLDGVPALPTMEKVVKQAASKSKAPKGRPQPPKKAKEDTKQTKNTVQAQPGPAPSGNPPQPAEEHDVGGELISKMASQAALVSTAPGLPRMQPLVLTGLPTATPNPNYASPTGSPKNPDQAPHDAFVLQFAGPDPFTMTAEEGAIEPLEMPRLPSEIIVPSRKSLRARKANTTAVIATPTRTAGVDAEESDSDPEDVFIPDAQAESDTDTASPASKPDLAKEEGPKTENRKKRRGGSKGKKKSGHVATPDVTSSPSNGLDGINLGLTIDSDDELKVDPEILKSGDKSTKADRLQYPFKLFTPENSKTQDYLAVEASLPHGKSTITKMNETQKSFLAGVGLRLNQELKAFALLHGLSLSACRDACGLDKHQTRTTSDYNKFMRHCNQYLYASEWVKWGPIVAKAANISETPTFVKLDSDARTIMWNNLKKELRSEDLVSIMEGVRKLWDADQKQIVNKEEMDTKKKRLNHASDLVKDFGKEAQRVYAQSGDIMVILSVVPGKDDIPAVSSYYTTDPEAFEASTSLRQSLNVMTEQLCNRHRYGVVKPLTSKTTRLYDPDWDSEIGRLKSDALRAKFATELSKLYAIQGPHATPTDAEQLLQDMQRQLEFSGIPEDLKESKYVLHGWKSKVYPGGPPIITSATIKAPALKSIPIPEVKAMLYKINEDLKPVTRYSHSYIRLGLSHLDTIVLNKHTKKFFVSSEGDEFEEIDVQWANTLEEDLQPIIFSDSGEPLLTRGDIPKNIVALKEKQKEFEEEQREKQEKEAAAAKKTLQDGETKGEASNKVGPDDDFDEDLWAYNESPNNDEPVATENQKSGSITDSGGSTSKLGDGDADINKSSKKRGADSLEPAEAEPVNKRAKKADH